MKRTLLTLLGIGFGLLAHAQLQGGVVYKINGTNGGSDTDRTFATLRSAATYVNAAGLSGTGQAILEFTAGYSAEDFSSGNGIIFNALANASSTLGLTIRPAVGVSVTFKSNIGNAMIQFNNADYVTIDGRPGGIGTSSAFTIENNKSNLITLSNGSQFNKITYLNLKSIGFEAVITLDAMSGATGNTHNTISNNTFGVTSDYVSGTLRGLQILSLGRAGIPNDNTIITNNNFGNWGSGAAIRSSSGNAWQINGNHFYSTEPIVTLGYTTLYGIYLTDSEGGHTIKDNFIGGQTQGAGGAKMQVNAFHIQLIYINGTSSSAKTTIQNNTIANIDLHPQNYQQQASSVYLMYLTGNQVFDVLGNTFGSLTESNSLVCHRIDEEVLSFIGVQAVHSGSSVSNLKNNIFANFSINNGLGNAYLIYTPSGTGGRLIDGNTFTKINLDGPMSIFNVISSATENTAIVNNYIGSQSSTEDIVVSSNAAGWEIYAIKAIGNFPTQITGNQIGGIKVSAEAQGPLTLCGIYAAGSTVANIKTVENNIIGGTVANSLEVGLGDNLSPITIIGIYSQHANVRNNTVRNIFQNDIGPIYGIQDDGIVGGVVANNTIQHFRAQINGSHKVYGINVTGSTPIISNSISNLYLDNYGDISGIYSTGTGLISVNEISSVECSFGSSRVFGISANEGIHILKNKIYDLKNNGMYTYDSVVGGISLATIHSDPYFLANNVIHINNGGDGNVFGLLIENTDETSPNPQNHIKAYYNTILLEGVSTSGGYSSVVYRTNDSPVELKNNLLFNNLSGGDGIHSLYGYNNPTAAWVSDHNFLATASGNTAVGTWNGMAQDFATWKAANSGSDNNSINDMSLTPSTFFNMASGTNNFLKTTATGKLKVAEKGTPIGAVTDDILGGARTSLPTIGAFEEVVVLPVTFKDFTTKLNGNRVGLNWNVGAEINILHYEVERMSNGADFAKIATVVADQLNNYSAIDANPQLGSNYYRLSAINNDGTVNYFEDVREVKVANLNQSSTSVYPNPLVGNTINIAMAAYSNGAYTYKLSDITGRLLQKGSFEHRGSSNTLNLKAAISKGIYVLQISNGREQFQVKLIKP
ncbi:T9SS type A sorting domain-containing protein [Pedobacter xixiisoli]|uniref:Por secretion system C-terminal sorting domain-containing protein n=1 Tax=Pedobacter xixiisoli TaxID=1476464 RepID=A0A285ZUI5_9SPHI|nr:T9SS type A sorting domain-containing protein [Pedobacter xixiisoli]SOD13317.1 Por secretion system C-terminal sorting domain-containing protein [Pedobacter xixiisoli]